MRAILSAIVLSTAFPASVPAQSFNDYLGGWAQNASACASGPQLVVIGRPSRSMTYRLKGSANETMVSVPSGDAVPSISTLFVAPGGSASATLDMKLSGGRLTVVSAPKRGEITVNLGGLIIPPRGNATLIACDAPAIASQKNWDDCEGGPVNGPAVGPDVQERGCTTLIDAGLRKPLHLMAAYNNRSHARRQMGKIDDALTDAFGAVQFDPRSADAINNRGLVWRDKGNYDLAIEDFSGAIALKADFAQGYSNRGAVRTMQGKPREALADFEAAIGLNPNFANAHFYKGLALEKLNEFARAEAAYSEFIRLKPGDLGGWNSRAWVRALGGSGLVGAKTDADKAVSLGPDVENVYDTRALVNLRRGDFAAAVTDANKALTLDPKMSSSLYIRGLAKRRMGQAQDGDADIAAARALDPKVSEPFDAAGIAP